VGSSTSPFSGLKLNGTLTSSVYSGDTSNPYGGLTFTYLLTISSLSPHPASELTVDSFNGLQTDVSYNVSGGGYAPSNFTRSIGDGELIHFVWLNGGGLLQGETSALLVVQTDATTFGADSGGVLDGQPVTVSTLSPIPEPGIASLLCTGLGLLFISRRRNSK
jgi:hypothetical protein